MIEIKRKILTPLVFNDAITVKEAVQCAVNNYISLSGADLSGADLSEAEMSGAYLSGADLSEADLSHANLFGADLSHANLFGANLSGADLSGADLSEAEMSGADLSGADLSEAEMSGAYLINADLSGADLSCLPLWWGSLYMKIDKRIFCQLLYHTLRAGESVEDDEVKKLFSIPEIVKLANKFHRAKEYREILQEKKTE